jgi:hypothetical protein
MLKKSFLKRVKPFVKMRLSDFINPKRFLLKPYCKKYYIFAFIESITSCDMELQDNIDDYFLIGKHLRATN